MWPSKPEVLIYEYIKLIRNYNTVTRHMTNQISTSVQKITEVVTLMLSALTP